MNLIGIDFLSDVVLDLINASKCEKVTCNKLLVNLTDLKQNISSCSSYEYQSIKTLEANIQILNETKCDDTSCKVNEMRIAEVEANACDKVCVLHLYNVYYDLKSFTKRNFRPIVKTQLLVYQIQGK